MALSECIIRFLLLKKDYVTRTSLMQMKKVYGLEEVQAYRKVLLTKWTKQPELDANHDLVDYVLNHSVNQLDSTLLTSNAFYQHVRPIPVKQGQWELTYMSYEPYQGLLVGDVEPQVKKNYLELTPLGYFQENLPYFVILQDDVVWMSVTPFEIQTMQPILDLMAGSVLTFGLGLGYFAGMAAMKREVTSVVVVERDKEAIALFKKAIYPFLPNKEKINIIHEDAFAFLETNKKKFTHIFVDIYHTADDGLPIYIQMKKHEQTRSIGRWHYWLEASILSLFRRYMILFLNEQLHGLLGEYYAKTDSLEDRLFKGMYQTTSRVKIEHVNDIKQLLTISSLKRLLESIDVL